MNKKQKQDLTVYGIVTISLLYCLIVAIHLINPNIFKL